MIASAHNAVGAMIVIGYISTTSTQYFSATIASIAIVVLLGVVSHYVTDAIPHGHYDWPEKKIVLRQKKRKDITLTIPVVIAGAVDMLASLALFVGLFWYLFDTDYLVILAAAIIGSQLPDLIMLMNKAKILHKNKLIQAEQRFHGGIVHWHNKLYGGAKPWTLIDIWQIGLVVLAIIISIHHAGSL